jgi:hypothetical protein
MQIKTLIFGKKRLNQGSYGRFLRPSSKLSSARKIPDRRIAGPAVGGFRRRMWDGWSDSGCRRPAKAVAITPAAVIEKMVLPVQRQRFNLQLPDSFLGINRVTNPGKTGSNHLLSTHWRRVISPLRTPTA